MRTIERDIVSAVLLSKDGKLLQAVQVEGGAYPGSWAIFGGGVEKGEDKRDALNREVMEETGIDISPYEVELVIESEGKAEKTLKDTGERVIADMKFYTYRVVLDKNASEVPVVLNEEHSEYRWCDLVELKDMKLATPSIELFKKLGYL